MQFHYLRKCNEKRAGFRPSYVWRRYGVPKMLSRSIEFNRISRVKFFADRCASFLCDQDVTSEYRMINRFVIVAQRAEINEIA